ncbi:MAG: hypothetical protein VX938_05950, partial [Myxococcota bacterium]|nr:hypothetical protein [Myxococcota bacterium]
MRITSTQALAMAFLLVVLTCTGCKDQGDPQGGANSHSTGGTEQGSAGDKGGDQANNPQGDKGDQGEGAKELPPKEEEETEDEKHPGHTYRDQAFKLTVKATFKDLPAGARVIAPSARDRRYQKVTKSDHSGLPGAVMVADDGENLFFVSDAITGKAEVSYEGVFSITRRVGTQGDLATAEGADWEGDDGKVTGASTAEALTT